MAALIPDEKCHSLPVNSSTWCMKQLFTFFVLLQQRNRERSQTLECVSVLIRLPRKCWPSKNVWRDLLKLETSRFKVNKNGTRSELELMPMPTPMPTSMPTPMPKLRKIEKKKKTARHRDRYFFSTWLLWWNRFFSEWKEDVETCFHSDFVLWMFRNGTMSFRKNKAAEFDQVSSQVWARLIFVLWWTQN